VGKQGERLASKASKEEDGEESDESEDEIEEELSYITPIDNVNPYITFKRALNSMCSHSYLTITETGTLNSLPSAKPCTL
jgi:hypothetical protein